MQSASKQIVLACLLVGVLYLVTQIVFLNFYSAYKLPLGRVDVDNYFIILDKPDKENAITHAGVYFLILGVSKFADPHLVFTFVIPFMSCVILNIVFFGFMLYFTKNPNTALLGLVFFILGTYSMQAFMISAYWAQLFATIFILLFIIFFEHYKYYNDKTAKILALVCFIGAAAFHMKVAGCVVLYIMIRGFLDGKYLQTATWAGIMLLGIMVYPDVLVSNYVIEMSVWYVFARYMFPLFWIIVALHCIKRWHIFNSAEKTWAVFFVMVFLISSQSALWRPLLSVLPLGIYFVTRSFERAFNLNSKYMSVAMVIFILCLMGVYSFMITSYSISSMIGEMVPGVFNTTYRHMDPEPLLKMFSGSKADIGKFSNINETHRVTGFVSSLTGQVTEKDEVIYGS
jgi:hypothetical protein